MNKKLNSHIKIGDKIKIISGNQKGLIGNIQGINIKNSIVFIDNILPRIRYIKNKQSGEAQKVERQIPIHLSNVMLWDSKANLNSRIGYKFIDNEKKRFFKKSGNFV
jgi:large subunit ribosomal protein L24